MGTPGVKEKGHENFSEKGSDCDPSQLQPAKCTERDVDVSQSSVNGQRVNSVHAKSAHENPAHENRAHKTPKIKFNVDSVQFFGVPAYSDHYALHPSQIVISNQGVHRMKPHMDRFTGKSSAVMNDRKI